MRGTCLSPTEIFWHDPEAIWVGRHLFGVLWNPDDTTPEQAEMISRILAALRDVGSSAIGEDEWTG